MSRRKIFMAGRVPTRTQKIRSMEFLTHKLPNSTHPNGHVCNVSMRTKDRCRSIVSEKTQHAQIKAADNNQDQGWEIDEPHEDILGPLESLSMESYHAVAA